MLKNIRQLRSTTGVGLAEKCVNEQEKKLKELKEYLKTIPPPPPEHTHELRMEKKLKRIIKEEEKETQLTDQKTLISVCFIMLDILNV